MSGRRIAIIGATGGIGSALARRLAADGAQLVLGGRRVEPLEALATEVGGHAVALDAARFEATDRFVSEAVERLAGLDGAVNCAGSMLLKPAHLTTEPELQEVLSLNLSTAFALVRAMGRHVRKGPSSVVLMSSAVARTGLANHAAMAAAKAGVAGLARSAAADYARRSFRVNAVAPGLVDTPLTEPIVSRERALATSMALHPLGRVGRAEEIAGLIDWLLSEESSWMTGQVLHLDGGLADLKL